MPLHLDWTKCLALEWFTDKMSEKLKSMTQKTLFDELLLT